MKTKLKKKAKQLIEKFKDKFFMEVEEVKEMKSKQCSLICVENEYSEKSKLLETLGCYLTVEEFQYEFAKIEDDYNEIKQEIELYKI